MNITREQVKEVAVKMFNADPNINQADKPAYEFEGAFIYENQDGEFLHARPRFRNPINGNKWIRALSFDGAKPVYKMPDYPNGKPLYNLPKIKDADVVYFVEGEKVAAWINRIGLVATTCGGAQDHDKADFAPLAGKTIYLWPDFDEAGKKHIEAVRSLLNNLGCTTHLIDIEALGLPPKCDAFDWLKANHPQVFERGASAEVLNQAADAVLTLQLVDASIEPANPIKAEAVGAESLDETIERLSKLRPAEYSRVKDAEAKRLGIKCGALDQEVRIKQKKKTQLMMRPLKSLSLGLAPLMVSSCLMRYWLRFTSM